MEVLYKLSPMIGIIQRHIINTKLVVTRGPTNTQNELESLLTNIKSETIELTNLKLSWGTHLEVYRVNIKTTLTTCSHPIGPFFIDDKKGENVIRK